MNKLKALEIVLTACPSCDLGHEGSPCTCLSQERNEARGYLAALDGEEMKETKAMVVELEDMVVKATVKLQQLFVEMKAKDAEIADKIKWIKAELKAEREKSAKLLAAYREDRSEKTEGESK